MMRWVFLCLVSLLLVVLVGCTSTPQAATPTPTAKPAPASPAPPVSPRPTSAGAPTSTPVQMVRIAADGRLAFVEHRKLGFRTSGSVDKVNVSDLASVKKGQVLAKLDTTTLEQAVKAAQLGVKAAEFSVKTAELDSKQVQGTLTSLAIDLDKATDILRKLTYPFTYRTFAVDIPSAINRMNIALAQIEDAQKNLQAGMTAEQYNQAAKQLRDARENLASARESMARGAGQDPFIGGMGDTREANAGLLQAKDFWTVRAAQQDMDKAQAALDNAQGLVSKAQVTVDKAASDVDRARNELDKAKDELDKAIIVAPFDGVAAKVNIKVGDFISSSAYATTVAIEVVDPRRMELVVKVNEIDIPGVKPGQKATIRVDALPDRPMDSTVDSIGALPLVEGGMVWYEVKIVFDVPQNSALRAGMAARADITVNPGTKVTPPPGT